MSCDLMIRFKLREVANSPPTSDLNYLTAMIMGYAALALSLGRGRRCRRTFRAFIRLRAGGERPNCFDNESPATTFLSVTVFPCSVTGSPPGTGEAPDGGYAGASSQHSPAH